MFFVVNPLLAFYIVRKKGCKKDCMDLFFDHVSYPYYTVLRNKAGLDKAGFHKAAVSESCQTGTANCNFIE